MEYIYLLRPKQWIKNIFVLAPLFFSGDIDVISFMEVVLGFIAFALLSSIIYILNDWCDIEEDKQHKKKKLRPLASGVVSPVKAGLIAFALLALLIIIFTQFNFSTLSIILLTLYAAINIAYSCGLKYLPIIELLLLASGYVIRLLFGASIITVTLSPWIIVCTGLLSLMLAVGKRRGELVQNNNRDFGRRLLSHYSLPYLDQVNTMLATATFTAYMIFCTSPYAIEKFGDEVIMTSPFVLYGILKYLKLLMVDKMGDDPTSLITSNRQIQIALVSWLTTFMAIIYF